MPLNAAQFFVFLLSGSGHDLARFCCCSKTELYLEFPQAAGEPPLQLKGFEKVFLLTGQAAAVRFDLDDRSVSTWDAESLHAWVIQRGDFGVMVGASSADIRLRGTVSVHY